jgi:hypothetical protein
MPTICSAEMFAAISEDADRVDHQDHDINGCQIHV